MKISTSIQNLIIEAYNKGGKITSKSQTIFSSLSFYLAMRDIAKYNIFEVDGINGREKIYKLTKKGKKIAELLIELKRLIQ